jgi:hypothetical protein
MFTTNFGVNVGLHIVILFTFLSLFFVFYITKISKATIENELSENIEKAIHGAVGEHKNELAEFLDKLPVNTLDKLYDQPEKGLNVNNKWLFKTILIINMALWILLIISVVLLKYKCGEVIDIKGLLIENALVFSCIGIVEYVFFTKIALKFVPVEPSFISQQFITSVKKNIIG